MMALNISFTTDITARSGKDDKGDKGGKGGKADSENYGTVDTGGADADAM